jgi:hypothetical protein
LVVPPTETSRPMKRMEFSSGQLVFISSYCVGS